MKKLMLMLMLAAVAVGAGTAVAREWSEDIQLTRTLAPQDSYAVAGENAIVYDNQGHLHIIYERNVDPRERLDSTRVFYICLDTLGNILQQQEISERAVRTTSLRGFRDSVGNIHYIWSHMFAGVPHYMYCRFSPEGQMIDETRQLNIETPGGSIVPVFDTRGRIWFARRGHANGFDIRRLTNDGELTQDTLFVPDFLNSNVLEVAIDPRDVIYVVYGRAVPGNVSMRCTAFDFNGEFYFRDYPLSDTTRNGMMSGAVSISIAQDSTIYLMYAKNGDIWVKGMTLSLDTIFDVEFDSTSNDQHEDRGTLDIEGRYHVLLVTDTQGQEYPERYHLTYAILDRYGDFVSAPQWIANWGRSGYYELNIAPHTRDLRYILFCKPLHNNPTVGELFLKFFPMPPDAVKKERVDNPDQLFFEVVPNPSQGNIIIRTRYAEQIRSTMEIYDISGRLVNKSNFEPTVTTIQTELDVGIYFARLTSSIGQNTQKIVVIK